MKDNKFKGFTSYFKSDNKGESLVNKVVESFSSPTCSLKPIVLYFRYYSKYMVYCSILNGKISLMKDNNIYYDLDELRSNYSEKYGDVECFNVLSESYVYLTKSGVYSQGEDLRSSNSKLCDNVFYILYATDCLDRVVFISNNFTFKDYGFIDKLYNNVNKDRWSMSLVDKSLFDNNRLSVLLYPIDDSITYDSITDRIYTKPVELYLDLFIYCKNNNLFLSHCGDLGIQIAVK